MIRLQPRFAELAAMTNFSFLRGASHPEEMVARAAALGLDGIGIADRNTLAGVVRAHVYARENRAAIGGLRVVTGARLVFIDGAPDVLAYPETRAAYGRLCRVLTKGNLRAPKGECHLELSDLIAENEGLRVVAMPGGKNERARLAQLREAFGARLWVGASLTYGQDMRGALARRVAFAREIRAPLIATNDALMHAPERRAARRRRRLHPRGRDAGGGGAADPGQRRAASEGRRRNGAPVRRGAGGGGADASASSTGSPSASTNSPTPTPRNCARASRARRPRSTPSPKRARARAIPTAFLTACARRSRMNSR